MTIKLSDRHKVVFDHLIPHKDVWDFCCDHGYVGTAAYKSQKFPNIYFVDQVTSIIEKLRALFEKYAFIPESKSTAYFFCQSGESLQMDICGTVCVTGVGGLTIFEILHELSKNQVLKADRLVLGPHRDDQKLLDLIANNLKQFHLQNEIEVTEKDRIRKIFIFEKQPSIQL